MDEAFRRVLLVDDFPELLSAMTAVVQAWGHTVRCAPDGEHALAIALSWQPDVVCLDLAMPRMNGLEVARRIVAAFGDRRPLLVAITGLSGDADRELAAAAGFDRFLVKPHHLDALCEILGEQPRPAAVAPPASAKLPTARR